MAGADALINCWDDKVLWSFWRPVTAIHEGDNDGNPNAIFLPEDETCFYLFEVVSAEDVAEAAGRAGLQFERIAEALTSAETEERQT